MDKNKQKVAPENEDKFRYNASRTIVKLDGKEYTVEEFRNILKKSSKKQEKVQPKEVVQEIRVKEAVMVPIGEPVEAYNLLKDYFAQVGGRPSRMANLGLGKVEMELKKLGLI